MHEGMNAVERRQVLQILLQFGLTKRRVISSLQDCVCIKLDRLVSTAECIPRLRCRLLPRQPDKRVTHVHSLTKTRFLTALGLFSTLHLENFIHLSH